MSTFSFDATPHYLFAVPPQRIFCVCPWIKLVIVLRHPVDRVVASYQTAVKHHRFPQSFAQFVQQDFAAMHEAGLLGDNPPKLGSLEEEDAWFRYLQLTRLGPVGQSLYCIQLRHWFKAIRDTGRKPLQVIKFVRYELWKTDPEHKYGEILDFLGLNPQQNVYWKSLTASSDGAIALVDPSDEDEATLRKLSEFFLPYNKRLYRILGGRWDGCWDD